MSPRSLHCSTRGLLGRRDGEVPFDDGTVSIIYYVSPRQVRISSAHYDYMQRGMEGEKEGVMEHHGSFVSLV